MIAALVITTAVGLALPAAHVGPAPPPSGSAATDHDGDVRTDARRAFAAGERAWAHGDYADAAEWFARAQELVPHPYTLYNLGLAQRRAGDPVAAWHTFEELLRTASTDAQRREAELARARVRMEVAQIEVRAGPGRRVCLDDTPLAPGERRVVRPGAHVVEIDGRPMPVEVAGGEVRTLERVGASAGFASPRPVTKAAWGVTVASAVGAAGLATGAALVDAPATRRGLAIGAGASAGIAASAAIALWVTSRRKRGERGDARSRGRATPPPSDTPAADDTPCGRRSVPP